MNDITYRPFIRDSALGDINIQIPNLEIPVYKPRYSQPLEDDTETEVQSQVEEIRNPEPIVQETTVHKFNSKKDFKDTMLPIYERLLKSKGLNPAFAKSLVAQDGLESAWGSKPAGSYNFGGIKGKGTTKRTREVINGKDIYINDQFRNFKSLEDYANFKIDLLNNKRYNAFSGDIKEFANRVHRGGYATDPRYANILNQVIASAKHGGVLKFQQGGIQEGKQWLEDWYKSRKGLVKQNVKQVLPIPLPVNVAQAPTKKKDTTLYAQLGLKIPKYQNPSKPIELPPLNSEGIVGNSNVIKDQRINKLIKDGSLWNTNNDLSKLEFRDSLMTNPTKALDFYNEYKTARQKGDIETLYNSGKTWYEPIMVRNSNYEWAKIVTDNFKGNDSQINAVLANTYTETQGWTRLKQNKKGPAKGIMMFEPKALELYNKWLNGREDSIALQVQYVSELFNEKNKILKTPWDRATEKDKQKALNTSEKDIDKLKDWERSIFMHKGYTTEQAWQDWESGDLTRATKAFEALFLRAGKPNLNKRIRAGEAINKYWYGKQ